MQTIIHKCAKCHQHAEVEIFSQNPVICPHCSKEWGKVSSLTDIFEHCPICQCRQFYIQKSFNRAAGCVIMLIGIILVPKTYGLSLPVVALIDWLLYKRVETMVVCYRCEAEFHGFTIPQRFKPFMHHIGLKYDKYRQ